MGKKEMEIFEKIAEIEEKAKLLLEFFYEFDSSATWYSFVKNFLITFKNIDHEKRMNEYGFMNSSLQNYFLNLSNEYIDVQNELAMDALNELEELEEKK